VRLESLVMDVRYALRGIRRSPLFAANVAATIGLGLGVLCSAVTIVNAYVLTPVDLPGARALYGLSWDTATVRRHRFRLADFEAASDSKSSLFALSAGQEAVVMQDGVPLQGMLVTGNYFQVIGARPVIGRTLMPADALAPGGSAVVVLSEYAWRSRYGADPALVGKRIPLGRQQFEVVGVIRRGMELPGTQAMGFFAPLTMARAFEVVDPWSDLESASLFVVGRLRDGATESQARAWFDVWLRQRFPSGSESEPVTVRVESRSTVFPPTGGALTMFVLIVAAFGLVLLVACANVTNLMLARGFGRQRQIAVRLSLGASRRRVVRQLVIEGLILAVPAAVVGLALTFVTARVFPALILATFPPNVVPVEMALLPLDPDLLVLAVLFASAVISAAIVSLAPAVRVTRANLVRAARGEAALDTERSRLRAGLVAMQIGACVIFLIGALGLVSESRRMANPDIGLSYERVADVRIAPRHRAELVERLAADPLIGRVAAARRPPLAGPLPQVGVVPSQTGSEQTVGFAVVSPDYFPVFDIQVVKGRAFTTREADEGAAVALVSSATARVLWPGLDPIGQMLEIGQIGARVERPTAHTSVRVIGVTEDVVNGALTEGVDATCVYFVTGLRSPEMSLLVSGRADVADVRASVKRAVDAFNPEAPYRIFPMREMVGILVWAYQAFSVTASLLGVIGLLLAFSGTYAVVAFLVAQRTPEFGIRMALGATVRQIVSGMMGETLRIAAIGLGAGLMVALALMRFLSGAIEAIPRFGPRPYVIGVSIVLSATTVAALLPSLRASRIDPSKALRAE
jgi:putative ABC transport system permease protein